MTLNENISTIRPMALSVLADEPLVSVVITAYNYAEFVATALNSVLEQDYRRMEIIVADDGSTDETPIIVGRYEERDPRVRLLRGPNIGQPANTSRGFAAATGDIICFLDADDEFRPGKIEATIQAFRRSPNCGLCLHPMQKVDERGRPFGDPFPKFIDSGWLLERLLDNGGRCSFPATSAIAIRREVGNRIFPIQSDYSRVGDAYIHYPAAFLTNVCVVSGTYSLYRCHQRSMSRRFPSTLARLAVQLQECEEVFSTNRKFVARELGKALAERINFTDSQAVLELALPYLLLSGDAEYKGLSATGMLGALSDIKRKRHWRLAFGLPRYVRKQLFLWRSGWR